MNRIAGSLLIGVFVFGCNGGDDGVDDKYPDHTFIFQADGQLQTMADTTFLQERPTQYRTTDRLPDLDVRALALIGPDLWAGTATGLARYDSAGDKFTAVALSAGSVPVVDIADTALSDGRLVVALADRVELFDPAGTNSQVFNIPQVVLSIATDGTEVYIGTEVGLGKIEAGAFGTVYLGVSELQVNDIAVDSSYVWLATGSGLIRFDGSQVETLLEGEEVRTVAPLPSGGILAGLASGAALVGTQNDRTIEPGVGALPCGDVTSVCVSGEFWAFGHGIGATVVEGDFEHVDHYHSQRWIPAEAVTDVALDGDRRRWIATGAGITRIELEETTLSQKAALFESYNDHFWRLDFVSCDGRLNDPWDPLDTMVHHDHDNDGLWTQMQIVAWSYAAAATGDDSYCDLARRAVGAMMQEIDLPAVSFEANGMQRGFVTRSFVRDDEGSVYTSKEPQDNWHPVEDYDGHDYYWKDDTSSDETDGHFFGYPVFYDLCAQDDAERETLAEHAGALARYIVEGGFKLIDLDGEPTTHGHWEPEKLAIALDGMDECDIEYDIWDCQAAAHGHGWLNATEILGHLLAAYHMTGDTYFYDAYEYLLEEHKYAKLVDFSEEVWSVTDRSAANHSDHELAFLAYHTLIRYEPDDQRRQRWIQSMLDMYQWELPERNPLWSAIVAGFVADGYHLEEAVGTLREWPEDWREFFTDNGHRKDAVRDPKLDRFGDPQFTTVLPYDEICFTKWNGNPYQLADCGDGRAVQAPWPWLLPYWMYRYHGVIE
jgi:hypothetical protein